MKLLLDANISWKLTAALKPIFGECDHVDLIGLEVPAEGVFKKTHVRNVIDFRGARRYHWHKY